MSAMRDLDQVPALTLRDVHVQYIDNCVLFVPDIELFPGDLVLLRGQNGSGKSSLLHGLAGIGPMLKGNVKFFDSDMTPMPASRRSRIGLRLLPQGRRIFGRLNAQEHFGLARRQLGGALAFKTDSSVNFGRLCESREPLWGASGGESKSILLASLLTSTARLVMLDEPFAGLDEGGTENLVERIKVSRAMSVGWIIVDHTGLALQKLQPSALANIRETPEGNTLNFSSREGGVFPRHDD